MAARQMLGWEGLGTRLDAIAVKCLIMHILLLFFHSQKFRELILVHGVYHLWLS